MLADASVVATALFGVVIVVGLWHLFLRGATDVEKMCELIVRTFLSALRPDSGARRSAKPPRRRPSDDTSVRQRSG